jgi:hypothetical protein
MAHGYFILTLANPAMLDSNCITQTKHLTHQPDDSII